MKERFSGEARASSATIEIRFLNLPRGALLLSTWWAEQLEEELRRFFEARPFDVEIESNITGNVVRVVSK